MHRGAQRSRGARSPEPVSSARSASKNGSDVQLREHAAAAFT